MDDFEILCNKKTRSDIADILQGIYVFQEMHWPENGTLRQSTFNS